MHFISTWLDGAHRHTPHETIRTCIYVYVTGKTLICTIGSISFHFRMLSETEYAPVLLDLLVQCIFVYLSHGTVFTRCCLAYKQCIRCCLESYVRFAHITVAFVWTSAPVEVCLQKYLHHTQRTFSCWIHRMMLNSNWCVLKTNASLAIYIGIYVHAIFVCKWHYGLRVCLKRTKSNRKRRKDLGF